MSNWAKDPGSKKFHNSPNCKAFPYVIIADLWDRSPLEVWNQPYVKSPKPLRVHRFHHESLPVGEYWRQREIQVTLNLHCPSLRNARLEPDLDWLRDQKAKLNLRELSIHHELNAQTVVLHDESGKIQGIDGFLKRHVPRHTCEWTPIRHDFETLVMVPSENGPLPHMAVVAVTAEVMVQLVSNTFTVRLDDMIAYCFRDVIEGSLQFLDQLGRPLAR